MSISSLSRFTPEQLANAREELKADETLYRSLLAQGLSASQVGQEMVKRGHGERYVALLGRRLAPADPNPDNSTAPSPDLPAPGSEDKRRQDEKRRKGKESVDSFEQPPKPSPDSMQWFLGGLDYERDQQTGLAKWPLSFKRIEKDVKRPNKGDKPGAHPGSQKPEQPPTCA